MEWLARYSFLLKLLGLLSIVTFVGSLIAIPWIIARLPEDYFILHRQRVARRHKQHPLAASLIHLGRNVIGFVLLVVGIAMLVLPGQGIITILIGISFMDFPWKHRLVYYLISRPRVVRVLNWIREKERKPPFRFS